MRRFLVTAPPWVLTVVDTLLGIVFLTLTYKEAETGTSWLFALGAACFTTALTVPFAWRRIRRGRCETIWVTGPLPPAQRYAVFRAASTGIAPTDPALRWPALALARYWLAEAVRHRVANLVTVTVLVGVGVVFTITEKSLWFATGAVLFIAAGVSMVAYPSRQRRRIARLEHATGDDTRRSRPHVIP